ncbi:hypothetical protein DL96DRAFT_1579476 [Flagelloscypha sp. PMI_526]|nr:hypothetical protein DL96DRAFT_1579476 [Flagelloscypha sp. PMI_526]
MAQCQTNPTATQTNLRTEQQTITTNTASVVTIPQTVSVVTNVQTACPTNLSTCIPDTGHSVITIPASTRTDQVPLTITSAVTITDLQTLFGTTCSTSNLYTTSSSSSSASGAGDVGTRQTPPATKRKPPWDDIWDEDYVDFMGKRPEEAGAAVAHESVGLLQGHGNEHGRPIRNETFSGAAAMGHGRLESPSFGVGAQMHPHLGGYPQDLPPPSTQTYFDPYAAAQPPQRQQSYTPLYPPGPANRFSTASPGPGQVVLTKNERIPSMTATSVTHARTESIGNPRPGRQPSVGVGAIQLSYDVQGFPSNVAPSPLPATFAAPMSTQRQNSTPYNSNLPVSRSSHAHSGSSSFAFAIEKHRNPPITTG